MSETTSHLIKTGGYTFHLVGSTDAKAIAMAESESNGADYKVLVPGQRGPRLIAERYTAHWSAPLLSA